MALRFLLLFICAFADITQIFPPAEMNDSFELIIRSNYTYDHINKEELGFVAGSTRTTIIPTFVMSKYITNKEEAGYMKSPKSISVNFYIQLQNGMNDTKIKLKLDMGSTSIRLSTTLPITYFIDNGFYKTIYSNNKDDYDYDVYSLNCFLEFLGNEYPSPILLAQISGIVSIRIPLKISASTSLKTSAIYVDNSQHPININAKLKAYLVDCNEDATICNDNKTSYILNERATFKLYLAGDYINMYDLDNLKVTVSSDGAPPIDLTSIVDIISNSKSRGEIIFVLPMVIIPQTNLSVIAFASISPIPLQDERILQSIPSVPEGIMADTILSIQNSSKENYIHFLGFLFLIFLIFI